MNRNWTSICSIKDRLLKMTLSTISLATEEGKRLVSAFSECFSEKTVGPVPMSVMLQWEVDHAPNPGCTLGRYLHSHDVIEHFELPQFEYAVDERAATEWKDPLLPETVPSDASVGDTVEIEGKKFVVVETNDSCGFMVFVPAECILLDCKVEERTHLPEVVHQQSQRIHQPAAPKAKIKEKDLVELSEEEQNMIRFDAGLPISDEAEKRIKNMPDILLRRLRLMAWSRLAPDKLAV